jgi:hypothetical protein
VQAIDDDYRVHWIADNLPVVTRPLIRLFLWLNVCGQGVQSLDPVSQETVFKRGFPVGFTSGSPLTGSSGAGWGSNKKGVKHYLNNHVRIVLQYHDDFKGTVGSEEDPGTKIVVSEETSVVARLND